MAFVKLVKNNAYFKRYQTKYRRRREGKTDFYARRRLITQDKDKYDRPKYRLVVRFTGSKVITQIIKSEIIGDKVECQANSAELKRWGLTAGLTNYASAYATGLLLARRLLTKLKMNDIYKHNSNVDGSVYDVNVKFENGDYDRRPFKAILDVGLRVTTTGNRLFGALKGCTDGGVFVPHTEKRFPGSFPGEEGGEGIYEPEVHRDRIFGVHVDKYMKHLKEADADDFKLQFSKWSDALKNAKVTSVEALYKKVHADIIKDPVQVKVKPPTKPNRDK